MKPLEPALGDLADRLAAAVGLPGAELSSRGAIDPARWLELAREHDVAPLLASRPGERPLPAGVAGALRADQARWAHQAVFRAAELRDLLDALAPIGEVIVLKGPAVAATAYADASERITSDLDLLVRDHPARRAAIAVLVARGYRPRRPASDHRHDFPLINTVAELEVDLHVDLTAPAMAAGALEDLWARRVRIPALGGLIVLDPVWRALHAAVHAVADPIGSPLLRNLLEAGWLTARLDDDDRHALVDRARRFGLAGPVGRALALAHRLFGSPAVLGMPRPGLRERWAWWRLGQRYGNETGVARTLEHVAEYHLRALDEDRHHRLDVRPLLATLASVATTQATSRLRAARARWRPPPLVRAAAVTRPLGDALLVHATDSDDVHVITADAIVAWGAAATPAGATALRARLAALGIPADRAAAAIEALTACGLLQPAR